MVDGSTAELRVREKVGVIPLMVALRAEIVEETPPRHLRAVATGDHVTMHIEVTLERADAGTELHSVFDVTGSGPLRKPPRRADTARPDPGPQSGQNSAIRLPDDSPVRVRYIYGAAESGGDCRSGHRQQGWPCSGLE